MADELVGKGPSLSDRVQGAILGLPVRTQLQVTWKKYCPRPLAA